MQERVVIAHGHIFKNAGSTFDWALNRNFSRGFCDHRDDAAMRKGRAEYLSGYLKRHRRIVAFSSHHLCMPLPEIRGIRIIPAFIFRHPIERVKSVYLFERRQRARTPGAIHAKKYNFRDYVQWRMQPDVNATIRNFQVRYCLGKTGKHKAVTADDLEAARALVDSLQLIGIVNRYDESMVIFEEVLSGYFQDIDLAYIRQNVSAKKESNVRIEDQAARILCELGDISDALLENNRADMELFRHANTRLDERVNNTGGFDVKLQDFRCRCSLLGG